MNIEITEDQKKRIKSNWEEISKETLDISADYLDSPIYAFGSELAVLRLKNKLANGRVNYSENMKSWFYVNKN
jgi:hypothetical protein